MSSANKKQRGKLEEEFRQRMHDAEASPSPDLWARIDHELTMGENEQNKKRVVFYRQLAAACFVLLVLAGSLLGYQYREDQAEGQKPAIAANINPANEAPAAGAATANAPEQQSASPETAPPTAGIAATATQPIPEQTTRAAAADTETAAMAAAPTTAGNRGNTVRGRRHTPATEAAETPATARTETIAAVAEPETVPSVLSPSSRHALTAVPATTEAPAAADKAKQQMLRTIAFQEDLPKTILELNKQLGTTTGAAGKSSTDPALALNNEEKTGQSGGNSRWSLGMAYMLTYFNQNIGVANSAISSFRTASNFLDNSVSATPSSYSNISAATIEFEDNTDPAYSFTLDLKTGFRLNKRLKLLTGIGYSQNAARTKSSYVVEQYLLQPRTNERYKLESSTIFLPSLNNSFASDSINVAKTDGYEVNYRYRQLSVPLGLQYEGKISKAWFWYGGAGMAANFLVESTIMASNSDVADVSYGYSKDSPFRRVQFSANVGAGVGKNISERVSVVAGPEFRTFLNTMLADPENTRAPQGRPYTIGFNMGVNYMLGTGAK